MNVVIVDPDCLERRRCARLLRRWGTKVVERPGANNLDEWLDRECPDAVLLPLDDEGERLCARLKRDPRHAYMVVVLISDDASMIAVQRALRAGADDLIMKPCPVAELMLRLRRHVAQRGTTTGLQELPYRPRVATMAIGSGGAAAQPLLGRR